MPNNIYGRNVQTKKPASYQEKRAISLDRREINDSDAPKFHRKNIFHNDVYAVQKTNNYNPLTCQIMGVYNQNDDAYVTTNNKQYGKPSSAKYDPSVFEKNLENKCKINSKSNAVDNDSNLIFGGKKQYDRQKTDFNPISLEGSNQMLSNAGKKQYQDRPKADFNLINGQRQYAGPEDSLQKEIGKKMFSEKGKADFNVISGQRNEEGKYISAKQEYHMDRKGEDLIKKRLLENSNNLNNLGNQFAGNISFFFFKP